MATLQLNLTDFAEWALTDGGPWRHDAKGKLKKTRDAIDPVTVKHELMILGRLQKAMHDHNNSQGYRGDALFYDTAESVYTAKDTFKAFLKQEGLKDETIERYMVVFRKYVRFLGREDLAKKAKGPYLPPKRRGTIISSDRLTAWLSSDLDTRLGIATWLLLAGVPVSQLVEANYGREVKLDGPKLTLAFRGLLEEPVDELASLLEEGLRRAGGRGPVFVSESNQRQEPGMRRNLSPRPSERPRMTTPGLRALWDDARGALDPRGPTMSEVGVVGRSVTLRRYGRGWVYVPRTDRFLSIQDS